MIESGLGFGRKRLIEKIITTNWTIQKPEEKNYSYLELLFVIQEMLEQEGKAYLEAGANINMGYQAFKELVKHLLYRNVANFDSMVLITAEKGAGKSSAAIMMAREWCKLIGIKFDPKRHIAYNNADVMAKIDLLNKFEPIILDEAVRFASASDWAKKENRELKKKLAQIRTKHLFFILCFPLKVYKLDSTYLQSYVNYWIDVYSRGRSAIFVKDKNPVMDAWRLKDFLKIGSYTDFTNEKQIAEKLKGHPNFWRLMKIPKPPDWLYLRYLKVREANVYDDDNVLQNVAKEDIHRALLILSLRDILLHDSTLTVARILLHIRNEYDVSLPKSAVDYCFEDAKQLVIKVREKVLDV